MKYLSLLLLAPLVALMPSKSEALSVGFEALGTAEVSDNVNEDNAGSELDGYNLSGLLSVFGDHQSQRIQFGFNGELGTYRQFDDLDTDTSLVNLSRFYGSLEVALTARSLSWYFGDVLGGSRRNDATQVNNEELLDNRRNVFITGPIYNFDLRAGRSINGSLFYINNSDESDNDLAELYSFNFNFNTPVAAGIRGGFGLNDVFVDNPEENLEPDYNRLGARLFLERTRGQDTQFASLGITRYSSDDYSVNGLFAQLRWDRILSASSSIFVGLTRDLTDESLSEIDSIATTGDTTVSDASGIFNNTVLQAGFKRNSGPGSLSFSAGISDADYEAVVDGSGFDNIAGDLEDRYRYFADLAYGTELSSRITASASLSYAQEEYRNIDDHSESLLGSLSFLYAVGRSFTAGLQYDHEINDARRTLGGVVSLTDSVENRVLFTLKYAPLSRVDKNIIVRLKSLVY